jgi:CheY-like chemotaxis protein
VKKRKITIVMAEAVVAMDIRRLLEILGYDVTAEVFRGEPAAVDVVDRPDLLLIDTSLPGGTEQLPARPTSDKGRCDPCHFYDQQIRP